MLTDDGAALVLPRVCFLQGVLSEYEAATAMRCVLEALAALHAADVVFGDVKPANFVRTKVGMLCLLGTALASAGALLLQEITGGAVHCCVPVCAECLVLIF